MVGTKVGEKDGALAGNFLGKAQGNQHPAEADGVAIVGGASPQEYAAEMAAIRARMEENKSLASLTGSGLTSADIA